MPLKNSLLYSDPKRSWHAIPQGATWESNRVGWEMGRRGDVVFLVVEQVRISKFRIG